MNTHEDAFSETDVRNLADLVGADWRYVAGADLSHHMHAPLSVIVATDHGVITITNQTRTSDFEGFESDYSFLAVVDQPVEWDVAKRKGNVYIQHQGEKISNVYVIRETISETRDGENAWEYTTDIGVIFELPRWAIAVGKSSHHTEMLVVRSAEDARSIYLPDRVIEWADELGVEHASSRQIISVTELLTG